ncbi:MAG: glycosyltransferase [Candidatus Jordarchaeales archaeon]
MEVLFVCSSVDEKFPQRDYHVCRELRMLGCKVRVVSAYNPVFGVLGVLRFRRVKCKIFCGFRAGVLALLLRPLVGEYFYDVVEWKADLCRDNWRGIKRLLVPLVEIVDKMIIRCARVVFNAGKGFVHPFLRGLRWKVVFAENGYNNELFNPEKYDRRLVREKYGVNFPLVVYIGKLTNMYVRYLVPVIEAMNIVRERFPSAEFWIIGDGAAREVLMEAAKGVSGVRVLGYVPYERVPEFVVMADVGVNAYNTESLKLREWLAMGLPVIAPQEVKFPGVTSCKWTRGEIAGSIIRLLENGGRVKVKVKLNTWRDTAEVIMSTCRRLYGD